MSLLILSTTLQCILQTLRNFRTLLQHIIHSVIPQKLADLCKIWHFCTICTDRQSRVLLNAGCRATPGISTTHMLLCGMKLAIADNNDAINNVNRTASWQDQCDHEEGVIHTFKASYRACAFRCLQSAMEDGCGCRVVPGSRH